MVNAAAGVWAVAGASALGARHAKRGSPNQDAMRWEVVSNGPDPITVLAVADGHGGSRYVRSQVGSQVAVDVACRIASEELSVGLLSMPRRQLERHLRGELIPRIVAEWGEACLSDLDGRPFTAEERQEAGDPLDRDPLVSYGSTLLVALLGSRQSVVLQLGDGDCLVVGSDGETVSPMPADPRLTGGETTSLCLPDAVSDFRLAIVGHLEPVMVLLASDGYGIAFADPGWREAVTTDLLAQFRLRGASHVDRMLPGWLADSAAVGGDDTTLLVAYRSGPRTPAVLTSKRVVATALALLGAAALGVAAGWTVRAEVPSVEVGEKDPADALPSTSTAPDASTHPSTTMPKPEVVAGAPGGNGNDDIGFAWLVAPSGEVVEFRPGAEHPMPRIVDRLSIGSVPDSAVFIAGVLWSLTDGMLTADEAPIWIESDRLEAVVAIDAENGSLWAATEEAARLVEIDPNDLTCRMFDVSPELEWPGPMGPAVTSEMVECQLTIAAGG